MHNVVMNIAIISFRRWICSSKTLLGVLIIAIFSFFTYSPLNEIVAFLGVKASPWIYNFLLSFDRMLIVFLGIILILHSDTFVIDSFSLELIIRAGRRKYITGQIIFLLFSTLFVCVLFFLMSIIFVLPSIRWETGWGKVFYTIAESSGTITAKTGISFPFLLTSKYLETLSPVKSTCFSLLFMWLNQIFMASLVGVFRIITGRNTGIAIAGIFAFISAFSRNVGELIFGTMLHYVSPATWASPLYLNWYGMINEPTPLYAGCVLTGFSILMLIVSWTKFEKGDIQINE